MQASAAIIALVVTYYAYQWGSGQKQQPHGAIVALVMMLSLLTTVPAYLIGRNQRRDK